MTATKEGIAINSYMWLSWSVSLSYSQSFFSSISVLLSTFTCSTVSPGSIASLRQNDKFKFMHSSHSHKYLLRIWYTFKSMLGHTSFGFMTFLVMPFLVNWLWIEICVTHSTVTSRWFANIITTFEPATWLIISLFRITLAAKLDIALSTLCHGQLLRKYE